MTPDEERFWSKVDRSGGPDACWPWTDRCFPSGYGRFKFRVRGHWRSAGAHRTALFFSDKPGWVASKYVCHRCDNPPCCNPAHLFLGTAADNAADLNSKNRQSRGERTRPETRARGSRKPNAKLSESVVREARRRSEAGEPKNVLAREYGVTPSTIGKAINGNAWRHA